MAFDANTQWDVRTTGSDSNGGGFVYGKGVKDVTAATDLAVDSSNNKKVTSASHNFVSGDVGKFINVTAGTNWTPGWYQILSTASNAATLDRSPAPVSTTGGTYDLYSAIDYSQQDSPQITYTDMVIDATTNTKFTSAGNPVTDAHVGNVINVTSGTGFTVQRVQIVSQSAGVATCDKSLGTLSSTGGNGKLGGSLLTPNKAGNLTNGVAGNTIHIKSGTYTASSGTSVNTINYVIPLVNTNTAIIGYGTNHYDGGTKPLITTATNSLSMIGVDSGSGENYYFANLSLSNTAASRSPGIVAANSSGGSVILRDCILDGFSKGINGDNGSSTQIFTNIFLFGTEIKNCTVNGIINSANTIYILDGSWIHGCTGDGITFNASGGIITVRNSIVSGNSRGITSTSGTLAIRLDNAVIANNTTDGVFVTTTLDAYSYYANSVFYGNGGWGINVTTGSTTAGVQTGSRNNGFGSNTSGDRKNIAPGFGDISLTASPFVSSSNFALNATAGGGLLLAKAGYPGAFAGGSSTSYLDVGAVQTSGGTPSGGLLTQAGMGGGISG